MDDTTKNPTPNQRAIQHAANVLEASAKTHMRRGNVSAAGECHSAARNLRDHLKKGTD